MSNEETKQPNKTTLPGKIEANRRNAQHSTEPKTDDGKAKISQNIPSRTESSLRSRSTARRPRRSQRL